MIYVILISVLLLLIITIYLFNKDFTEPAFFLLAPFLISTVGCCLYSSEWNFNDYRLALVIISGLTGFVIFSFYTYKIETFHHKTYSYKFEPIFVNDLKLWVYLLFQMCLYGIQLYLIMKTAGIFSLLSISDAIGIYYNANHSGQMVYSSAIVNIGNILNMPGIYYIIYMATNNIICKKKNHLSMYLNIIVGMAGCLLNGTRTTFFMYIIAFLTIFIILRQRYNGWKRNINIKTVFKSVFMLFMAILLFNALFSIQGRKLSDITFVDLIANYMAAPIKNLDLFIQDGRVPTDVFGTETFSDTYAWFNEILGHKFFVIPQLYKYRWINGKILGNVYTQFMPLYNDFGVLGVFIVMGLLGSFSQHLYDNIKFKKSKRIIDFRLIIYSYVSFAIIFSFFSNKFFELVFARAMIYFVIGIYLFDIYFRRLRIRDGKLVITK